MKKGKVNISGIIFCSMCFLIALFFFIPALGFPGASADGAPGPGYFPIITSVCVMIFSVLVGIGYLHDDTVYFQQNDIQKQNLANMLIVGIGIVIYSILFIYLPFIPLTICFVFFLGWKFDKPWRSNLIFAVVFTLFFYYLFSKFLHVML